MAKWCGRPLVAYAPGAMSDQARLSTFLARHVEVKAAYRLDRVRGSLMVSVAAPARMNSTAR